MTTPASDAERGIAIAAEVLGTCRSTPEELFDKNSSDEMRLAFDQEVRRCDCCSWWMETDEVDDDDNCSQCQEDIQ